MLDALLCLTDPGDEVILTDPTYAGMLNRVRLAGAVPRLVPMHSDRNGWRMDLDALSAAATDRTRVVFLNNASFPTGWVGTDAEWEAVTKLCNDADLWLLYWAGFEAVLYDGRDVVHPAALPGMRERTVIVGAPSFEQRMIAWRVGWMVMPGELTDPASRTQIYNGLVASGFAQIGTKVALELGDDDVTAATAEWQLRRDETLRQLEGLPVVPARRLVGAPRHQGARCHTCRALGPAARPQGRGDADGRVGRRGRSPAPEVRVQQRAGRPAPRARRPRPRGARMTAWSIPGLSEVLAAQRRIAAHLRPTPLFTYSGPSIDRRARVST